MTQLKYSYENYCCLLILVYSTCRAYQLAWFLAISFAQSRGQCLDRYSGQNTFVCAAKDRLISQSLAAHPKRWACDILCTASREKGSFLAAYPEGWAHCSAPREMGPSLAAHPERWARPLQRTQRDGPVPCSAPREMGPSLAAHPERWASPLQHTQRDGPVPCSAPRDPCSTPREMGPSLAAHPETLAAHPERWARPLQRTQRPLQHTQRDGPVPCSAPRDPCSTPREMGQSLAVHPERCTETPLAIQSACKSVTQMGESTEKGFYLLYHANQLLVLLRVAPRAPLLVYKHQ